MNNRHIPAVMRTLETDVLEWPRPVVIHEGRKRDPFRILISCLISLRTRDEVTGPASKRLFALADNPKTLLALPLAAIEEAIYPSAFFRAKAKSFHKLCRDLAERHGGRVPDTLEDLLGLKGVGRKTANLTLILGFDGMGICVDTHVHRIINRWGYVKTKSADETEMALRKNLNRKYWKQLNSLLVAFGQNQCRPISPLCNDCRLSRWCLKVGVSTHR